MDSITIKTTKSMRDAIARVMENCDVDAETATRRLIHTGALAGELWDQEWSTWLGPYVHATGSVGKHSTVSLMNAIYENIRM